MDDDWRRDASKGPCKADVGTPRKLPTPLDADVQQRLSHLFGSFAALRGLLPVPERANEWIRKPNTAPLLVGASAPDRMMGGQVADLFAVRQYAELGGKA